MTVPAFIPTPNTAPAFAAGASVSYDMQTVGNGGGVIGDYENNILNKMKERERRNQQQGCSS
jgi:hypothetical protein